MDDDIAAWWSAARSSAPDHLAGLWFGLVELVPAGWSMYVAGTRSFDAADEAAEWAVGPYAWQPPNPYVAMPEIGHLDVTSALEHAADVVRRLDPWRDVPIAGVAVGFDDGDVTIVYAATPEEPSAPGLAWVAAPLPCEAVLVRFRPLPETRVANAVPGVVSVALCVNVLLEGNDVPQAFVWLGIVLGIVVAVRGFRMAVVVADDRVVVRGLAASRSVPTQAVIGVSDTAIPQLRWRGANGAERRSPILAFADAWGGLARYAEHNRESLRRLRLEITHRQDQPSR